MTNQEKINIKIQSLEKSRMFVWESWEAERNSVVSSVTSFWMKGIRCEENRQKEFQWVLDSHTWSVFGLKVWMWEHSFSLSLNASRRCAHCSSRRTAWNNVVLLRKNAHKSAAQFKSRRSGEELQLPVTLFPCQSTNFATSSSPFSSSDAGQRSAQLFHHFPSRSLLRCNSDGSSCLARASQAPNLTQAGGGESGFILTAFHSRKSGKARQLQCGFVPPPFSEDLTTLPNEQI